MHSNDEAEKRCEKFPSGTRFETNYLTRCVQQLADANRMMHDVIKRNAETIST